MSNGKVSGRACPVTEPSSGRFTGRNVGKTHNRTPKGGSRPCSLPAAETIRIECNGIQFLEREQINCANKTMLSGLRGKLHDSAPPCNLRYFDCETVFCPKARATSQQNWSLSRSSCPWWLSATRTASFAGKADLSVSPEIAWQCRPADRLSNPNWSAVPASDCGRLRGVV